MKSLPRSLAWLGECAYQQESTVTAMASKNLLIKMMIDCKWLLLSAYKTTVVMRGQLQPLQQLAEPCVFPPPHPACAGTRSRPCQLGKSSRRRRMSTCFNAVSRILPDLVRWSRQSSRQRDQDGCWSVWHTCWCLLNDGDCKNGTRLLMLLQ